ncbi:MAG: inorganic diphosphatase [Gammaproteobacteria bacterium]
MESTAAPAITVLIEVPRGSFAKRDAARRLEFLSPLPCPFNYGSVPALRGADHDALDAVVLGPRLAAGTTLCATARAVVRFVDAGHDDDKLICAAGPLTRGEQRLVLASFHFYALVKRLRNAVLRRPGRTRCAGFGDLADVLARAARR